MLVIYDAQALRRAGKRWPTVYCSFCGKEIPDQSTFCGYCGKKLVYIGDQPDDDSFDDSYDQEAASWFGVPSWGYYEEEWEEGITPAEEVSPEDEVAADEDAADDAVAGDGEAESDDASASGASDTEAASGENVSEGESACDDAASGESTEPSASDGTDEEAVSETSDEDSAPDSEAPAFGPVRPAMRPLSKDAFADAASGGVYVPKAAATAGARKRGLAAPAVVGIAAAALIVGAAGTFALTGPFSPFGSGAASEEPSTSQPASSEPADNTGNASGETGAAGTATEGPATEAGADAAEEAETQTGFSSAKKLVAALETPLFDALGENFSHTSMRLLVLDELDFMLPAYAEALAREAGFTSVKDFARNAKDAEAEQFGQYAGTWSFKLARGSKCSTRTVERIERSCQILGVDIAIEKAFKIEAVTSNYPSDYDSKNVDDEGLYHKVTPYTAIQVEGRWYLYTDALAVEKSDDKED